MKKTALALTLSIVSVSFLQSTAWSTSSLLMQMPAILAESKSGTTMINDNVTVIDESNSAKIIGTNTGASGETELKLSSDLADTAQVGSVLYVPSGVDSRFPFGIAGKVVSMSSNVDGTKTVVLGEASYADVVKEASFNLDNITLDASNFVGVIAPTAVEAASPSPMPLALAKSTSDGSVYSFRDGAVMVRRATDRSRAMYSAAEGGTIDAGTVSLNMKVDLAKMGVDASRMSPVDTQTSVGFVITGSLSNIKLTNEHDFSLFGGGLKSLDMRVDGDFNFDVKFNGNGSVKLGYFSQAWDEVKDESFKAFGASAKLTGLSVDDKIGKFPLAGLVWSVPCPNTCPVLTGQTQTPLRQAKTLGVIVWLYLTADGEFSLDGNLTIARLNQAGLSVGIKKPSGSDFQLISSLTKKSNSSCMMEFLKLKGTAGLQIQGGITTDIDFFVSGVRIANAGADAVGLLKAEAIGEAGYCVENFGSSGSWKGDMCYSGGFGYGLIARASANVGIEVETSWKNTSVSLEYEYEKQIPDKEDIDKDGRHGLWYYKSIFDTCEVPTVTSKTGRIWMDRNLGASQVATNMTDTQAYGDLYQWGRLADGHEKRTSGTTTTLSSADNPGFSNFILSSSGPSDWRSQFNNNLWQGKNGINNPCPSGFRLPTAQEWREEIKSWNSQNANGAFASPLKLITTDYRSNEDGKIIDSLGGYWSSTVYDYGAKALLCLDYDLNYYPSLIYRSVGLSVRCIKDIPPPPVEAPKTVTSKTGKVWLDRNLGAARVATSIDDELAYGDLYQWGRLADGHEKRTSGISETMSSSDVPGHSNHIVWADWRNPQNNNLWQGENSINNPCPLGFRLPTTEEWQEEINSWNLPTPVGAFSSPLKLPHGGYRSFLDGLIRIDGPHYWASNVIESTSPNWFRSKYLFFSCGHGDAYIDDSNRGVGMSVRCIKD